MQAVTLTALWVYRRWLTRRTPKCRQIPSCSAFCLSAVREHGWLEGLEMTLDRMGPCL
jgi:putative component of membrane protein insertase Oxa1/YidC/SpoIIIJ protein YidD